MSTYIEILRPTNSLMAAFAVFIGSLLVNLNSYALVPVYLAMAAAFFISGGGMIINDYFDAGIDKINRPDRPIPSGRISKRAALSYSFMLFLIGIVLSGFINWIVFAIAIANSLLLIVYSHSLKSKLLAGNIIISYLVGSTFIFGSASPFASSNIRLGVLLTPFLFALLAFLANLSREIVKTFEDIEGDRQGFLKKMVAGAVETAARFGLVNNKPEMKYKKPLKVISVVCPLLAVIISPLPYLLSLLSVYYLFVVWVTDLLLIISAAGILCAKEKKHYRKIAGKIKIAMLVGLIAFLAGIVLK
jgi:geranylgeranylglycerol-phosphate geranylgeranyltransferase